MVRLGRKYQQKRIRNAKNVKNEFLHFIDYPYASPSRKKVDNGHRDDSERWLKRLGETRYRARFWSAPHKDGVLGNSEQSPFCVSHWPRKYLLVS